MKVQEIPEEQVTERTQEQIVLERIEEQTVEGSSEVMRLQALLLSSVAALSRVLTAALSLDQRIIEHERRIQEQNV